MIFFDMSYTRLISESLQMKYVLVSFIRIISRARFEGIILRQLSIKLNLFGLVWLLVQWLRFILLLIKHIKAAVKSK